jgi:hypothetical protein
MGNFLAEHRSLHVGGAEVDAAPHSGVDDLLERVREAVEAPRGTRFVAEGTERDLVGAEEVFQRVICDRSRPSSARNSLLTLITPIWLSVVLL